MRAIVLAILLLGLIPLGLVRSAPGACDTLEDVPLQGPSCRVPGGWAVYFEDGSWTLTHGPDAMEDPASPTSSTTGNPDPLPPVCVANPATQFHSQAIYAVPADQPDRSSTYVANVRKYVGQANAHLRAEGAAEGRTLNYKFRCDATDVVTVSVVRLSVSTSTANFSSIVSDLRAKGFSSSFAKYWVWYDGDMTDVCGQGSIFNDATGSGANANNNGNEFALTYRCGWTTMMHENGHNMGAVQLSAPHSSGGWHCNDGYDIMCYADGGSTSAYTTSPCYYLRSFDCKKDDYFDPTPPAGSYLANNWNIGATYNRFLEFDTTCDAVVTGWVHETQTRSYDVPPGCAGKRYTLAGGRVNVVVTDTVVPSSDLDVCWSNGATQIRCDRRAGPEYGTIPPTATRVQVVLGTRGAPTDHQLLLG